MRRQTLSIGFFVTVVFMSINLTNGSLLHLSTGDTAPAAAGIVGQLSVDEETKKQLVRNALLELRRGVMSEYLRNKLREKLIFESGKPYDPSVIFNLAFSQYQEEQKEIAVDVAACLWVVFKYPENAVREKIQQILKKAKLLEDQTLVKDKLQEMKAKIDKLNSLKKSSEDDKFNHLLDDKKQHDEELVAILTQMATNVLIEGMPEAFFWSFLKHYVDEDLTRQIIDKARILAKEK